ncbi:hypothetical protein TCAL_02333 [Tigriopus californicus]|uniref:E3 ubiquitin-protein ligase RNF10 n=1 Tax=Tigriopus californicus TaxID=6832 RepID=A0A553NX12_TIGCA|nr:E3 ubiquitin-protein ligase RNF10-like [Tigriopus californicus]TRY69969.1 hypothetical protein TCAL_02333 [Tigriopus californicus]|eukprot:TCALIF_02333-PA protein Name:"Similar to rnf10 RING finger protein 10 (Xenopus laevis)" AED:0.03 eAED:0.03 QI:454/1/1/1/0.8/0.66/6/645/823
MSSSPGLIALPVAASSRSLPLTPPAAVSMASAPPLPPSASSAPRSSSHQRNPGLINANGGLDAKKGDSLPGFHHGKSGKSASARHRGSRGPKPDSVQGGARSHTNSNQPQTYGKGRFQPKRSAQRHSSGYQSEDSVALAVAPADEFEYGSVFKSGCKKRNFNHLLNFQYEPRGINQPRRQTGEYNARSYGGTRRKNSGNYRPKYKKEQYLQANCQFVVRTDGDYTANLTNPDCIVDWDLVEQVGLKTSGVPSCPICLYPPTAAKIARCGHIFCWSCILHYLALSDYPSRDCPICFVAIFKQDLKSVVSLLHSDYNTGSEIEMRLMRRERSSLFAVPVGQYHPEINKKHPSVSMANNSYSQLLLASPFEVANEIIARERNELEEQYRCDKDEPESCFIQEALQYLTQREALIRACKGFTATNNIKGHSLTEVKELQEIPAPVDKLANTMANSPLSKSPDGDEDVGQLERPRHLSSSSDGASSVEIEMEDDAITAEDLDLSNLQPANKNEEDGVNSSEVLSRSNVPKDTFYFYQSADGQPIYLHALNVQMLVHQFGSFENCPSVIKGKIVEKDSTAMSEDLRNRLRYLRHLPITSMFEVCELQLSIPAHFSPETLALFKEQIESRRRKRARRARDEKRREKKIQLEEDKLLGKFPGAKLRIESEFHFPEVGRGPALLDIEHPTLNESFASSRSTESLDSVEGNVGLASQGVQWGRPRPVDETIHESAPASKSFATMLRRGAPNHSSALKRSETFPTPVAPRPTNHSDSEPEPEGYVPPPPQAKLGDSLAQALEQFSLNKAQNPISKDKGRKKGKKMKGTKFSLTG